MYEDLEWFIRGKLPDKVMDQAWEILEKIKAPDWLSSPEESEPDFSGLEDWQIKTIKKITDTKNGVNKAVSFLQDNGEISVYYDPASHTLEGDYISLYAVGIALGCAMRQHGISRPIFVDSDMSEVVAIGPKDWWGMGIKEIGEDPIGSMLYVLKKVAGQEVAEEMLEEAAQEFKNQQNSGPTP